MLFSLLIAAAGYNEPWGKDADLHLKEPRPVQAEYTFPEQVIRFHQKVLSPVDGPRSHFVPCSSTYMLKAIRKHGFLKGYAMGCDRLMRENSDPWVYRKILTREGAIYKWDPPP